MLMGCRKPRTDPTDPVRSVVPSITEASSSTSPRRLGQPPRPTVRMLSSISTSRIPASIAPRAGLPSASRRAVTGTPGVPSLLVTTIIGISPTQEAERAQRHSRCARSRVNDEAGAMSRELLPERLDDGLLVVADDEVEPVHVVGDAGDAVIRHDHAEVPRQILLAYHARGAGGRLSLLGEFLADALFAILFRDLDLGGAGQFRE